MKYFIIASVSLTALNVLLTLALFFGGKSTNPRKDVASILFGIGWIAWGIFLLVSGQ